MAQQQGLSLYPQQVHRANILKISIHFSAEVLKTHDDRLVCLFLLWNQEGVSLQLSKTATYEKKILTPDHHTGQNQTGFISKG